MKRRELLEAVNEAKRAALAGEMDHEDGVQLAEVAKLLGLECLKMRRHHRRMKDLYEDGLAALKETAQIRLDRCKTLAQFMQEAADKLESGTPVGVMVERLRSMAEIELRARRGP